MTEKKAPPVPAKADLTRLDGGNGPQRPGIDDSDIVAFCGLLLLGAGLWWLSPPVALIVVGVVLLGVGLVGAWRKGERATDNR